MRFEIRPGKRQTQAGTGVLEIEPEAVVVAGFTGRDQAKVRAHIEELAREGITSPASVPTFYLVPPASLVQTSEIVTVHPHTSGEVEIALLVDNEKTFVTLASDHTDRAAEALDIAVSKLACPKILATAVWPLADVLPNWDSLRVRSWIDENGQRHPYQDGAAATLLAPQPLLEKIPFQNRPACFVLLMGTLPVIGAIRGSRRFWAELFDHAGNRTLQLDYRIRHLGEVLKNV